MTTMKKIKDLLLTLYLAGVIIPNASAGSHLETRQLKEEEILSQFLPSTTAEDSLRSNDNSFWKAWGEERFDPDTTIIRNREIHLLFPPIKSSDRVIRTTKININTTDASISSLDECHRNKQVCSYSVEYYAHILPLDTEVSDVNEIDFSEFFLVEQKIEELRLAWLFDLINELKDTRPESPISLRGVKFDRWDERVQRFINDLNAEGWKFYIESVGIGAFDTGRWNYLLRICHFLDEEKRCHDVESYETIMEVVFLSENEIDLNFKIFIP